MYNICLEVVYTCSHEHSSSSEETLNSSALTSAKKRGGCTHKKTGKNLKLHDVANYLKSSVISYMNKCNTCNFCESRLSIETPQDF